MIFDKIVEALKERSFVTRRVWRNELVIFLGLDLELWYSSRDRTRHHWRMSGSDFLANDWEILPYKFQSNSDYYLPFEKGIHNPELEKYRDKSLEEYWREYR